MKNILVDEAELDSRFRCQHSSQQATQKLKQKRMQQIGAPFTLLFIILLAFTGQTLAQSADTADTEGANIGTAKSAPPSNQYRKAPSWTLENAEGELVSSEDFAGKATIIHFWGTWCPYCKKLHPGLERVRAKYESQGLEVIGISVNEPIGAKPAEVLKERGIHFPTLLEGDDVAAEAFEVYGTPTTIFISPQGEILGQTMESNPDDPRFDKIAAYLLSLKTQ